MPIMTRLNRLHHIAAEADRLADMVLTVTNETAPRHPLDAMMIAQARSIKGLCHVLGPLPSPTRSRWLGSRPALSVAIGILAGGLLVLDMRLYGPGFVGLALAVATGLALGYVLVRWLGRCYV